MHKKIHGFLFKSYVIRGVFPLPPRNLCQIVHVKNTATLLVGSLVTEGHPFPQRQKTGGSAPIPSGLISSNLGKSNWVFISTRLFIFSFLSQSIPFFFHSPLDLFPPNYYHLGLSFFPWTFM